MEYQWAIAAGMTVGMAVYAPALAEQASPEEEQKIDKFALTYEDLANALDGVEDATDADLVAARVAADLLLLRELNTELRGVEATEMSPEFAQSFATRCAEAGKTSREAMERLRERSCFESDALQAALSLAPLVDAPLQKSPAMATAAMELVANNREMVILILDEAADEATAPQVAALVQAAMAYGEALSAFAAEVGVELLEIEQKQDFGQRFENYQIDFAEHRSRLMEREYFGCDALRAIFEHGAEAGEGEASDSPEY